MLTSVAVMLQLVAGGVIDDTFSLCFGSVEGDGALLLGDVEVAPYTQNLSYTNLVSTRSNPHFYTVVTQGMAVNGTVLPLSAVSACLLPMAVRMCLPRECHMKSHGLTVSLQPGNAAFHW